MIKNQPLNVGAAFEMLLEEIEAEVEFVNGVGSRAFESSNYEQAREALSRAAQITSFRARVATLRQEWQALAALGDQQESAATKAARQNLGKLRKGLRTPEEAYRKPILEALDELGGQASVGEVLELVFKKMQGRLNEYDLQPLASDAENPRWRNAAQWCRNTMVQEGLLRTDSPRGEWAISPDGRDWLRRKGGM